MLPVSDEIREQVLRTGREEFGGASAERGRPDRRRVDREYPASRVLALQRAAGNRAVAALIQRVTQPRDPAKARAAFAKATENHAAQSAILAGWLAEGRRSADLHLKNACDWVANGNAKLFAVSPTGDTDERVAHTAGDPKTTVAYFPKAVSPAEGGDIADPGGGNYNWQDLDDEEHVNFRRSITRGWNSETGVPSAIAAARLPTNIGLFSRFANATVGPVTKEEVFTTLRHEVQHAADRHHDKLVKVTAARGTLAEPTQRLARLTTALQKKQPFAEPDLEVLDEREVAAYRLVHAALTATPPQLVDLVALRRFGDAVKANEGRLGALDALEKLESYKTEYRAYSYQGTFDGLDNAADHDRAVPQEFRVSGRHWTKRQYLTFRQIYGTYAHTKEGWDENPDVLAGGTFREEVLRYRDPDAEGVNKLNSLRINHVYDLLLAIEVGTNLTTATGFPELEQAAGALTAAEATYLCGAESVEFNQELEDRLDGAALRRIRAVLDNRARG